MTVEGPPSLAGAAAAGSPKQFSGSSQDGGGLSCSRRTVEEQIGKLKLQINNTLKKIRIVKKNSGNVSLCQGNPDLQFCGPKQKKCIHPTGNDVEGM